MKEQNIILGEVLSPILSEIELALLEYETSGGLKPNFTKEGFRAGIKIFMSVLMDKIWELQEVEKMNMEDRINMANKVGEELRKLIKCYTDIDTHELYK